MTHPPVIRLHLFFARDCDRAVILRQGPSTHFRMILWHRDTDRFEDGQWVKHKIYPERCSLSPDGRHFLYFALDGKWQSPARGSFTAISRPPWFTALALYPEGDTWGGGGAFVDDAHYVIDTPGDATDIIGRAGGLHRVFHTAPSHRIKTGIVLANGAPAPLTKATVERLLHGDTWRPPFDRYDTQGGVLYRRAGGAMHPIRDFGDMAFEPLRAPYAEAPGAVERPAWHPLNQEPPR